METPHMEKIDFYLYVNLLFERIIYRLINLILFCRFHHFWVLAGNVWWAHIPFILFPNKTQNDIRGTKPIKVEKINL